ncbi:unnamed protein product [Spirodela intermedia]|uniref:Uncharacterized protein n=1 Tax=Spirodela intermedia TaxID=51605 RepID=A0A7I8KZQ9_SPIIN|nr:unnamed protein product [Spirodela intermedia]
MGYWKSKLLPKIKKVFDKGSSKKAAAAEATKAFDDSKEEITKEYDEKKTELEPKVVEIYGTTPTEIKTLVKEPTEAGVKKHAAGVNKFLEELVKIEFPGAKAVSEASTKFGPTLVTGPVFFVFEKAAVFLPAEEPKTAEPEAAAATTTEEAPAAPAEEGTSKDKEVVVVSTEEEKKVEAETPAPPEVPPVVEEKVAAAPAAAPEPAKPTEGAA